jgi:tetratricopeptide (TPR) repeat protein
MELDVLDKSKDYIHEGQFEKAQVILRRVLHSNPNDERALELSGDLAQRTGKKEDALKYYEQAAGLYLEKNHPLPAILCYEKMLKMESMNSDRYVRLAQIYKQAGLPNQGIQKIIELCSLAIENKDETTFITGLRKIVELQHDNLQLGLSYARILKSMNRSEQVEGELNRIKKLALERNDQGVVDEINKMLSQTDGGEEELDPKSRVELGNLLYEIGSKEEAIVEFNKAASDLLEQGNIDEAITVLNRIVEIDPDNEVARSKLRELRGEIEEPTEREAGDKVTGVPLAEEGEEEAISEISSAEVPTEEREKEIEPAGAAEEETVAETEEIKETEPGMDIFDDLIREVETYVETAQGKAEPEPKKKEAEEPQTLEGQIADIEFLLKEMEAPSTPSFEIATEFDDFRSNIIWTEEDVGKRLELARQAFAAELYDITLMHAQELKINKHTWPLSLELTGAALVKLGKYSEAIKTVGPAILLEDIPQTEKLELRYLLASAYEGLGDFENALRETEHIMSTNPDYKDVKEMYELLGGKRVISPAGGVREEKMIPATEPIIEETGMPLREEQVAQKEQEPAPIETEPETPVEKEEEIPEEPRENISFL